MNRRGFIELLAASAAGIALDPERLLWRPTKTIFIPTAAPAIPTVRCVWRNGVIDCLDEWPPNSYKGPVSLRFEGGLMPNGEKA